MSAVPPPRQSCRAVPGQRRLEVHLQGDRCRKREGEHRRSYTRRTAVERASARLSDPAGEGARRGWCRLFGTAKNALMYALAAVVHNVRMLESREREKQAEARRAAYGASGHPRTRTWHHTHEPPDEPVVKDEPAVPG